MKMIIEFDSCVDIIKANEIHYKYKNNVFEFLI